MGLLNKLFGPRTHTVTAQPSGRQFVVNSGQSILKAALAQGIAFPHSCTVGTCGSCKCKLRSGKIREIANFAYVLNADELRAGIILACQAAAKTDVTLEVPNLSAKRLQPATDFVGTLTALRDLTHDIKRYTLTLDRPLRFDAGQYVQLSTPEVWGARAYSLAVPPLPEGNLEISFFIRQVPGGAFTDWLFTGASLGKAFKVHGPAGNFWLRESRAPFICIAGGSGLAPLMAILQHAVARQIGRPCVVLFGARTAADLYGLDEIAEIKKQWNGAFVFIPVLSNEAPGNAWTGERGLVTERIAAHVQDLAGGDSEAYLCGPPPMIDAALPRLAELGFQPANIHCDKFLDGSHGLQRQD